MKLDAPSPSERILRASGIVALMVPIVVLGLCLGKVATTVLLALAAPLEHRLIESVAAALWGTVQLGVWAILLALPIAIATAMFLEEKAEIRGARALVDWNIALLAGMPSIFYGVVGMVVFEQWLGWQSHLMTWAATLALLAQPIIIVPARLALRRCGPEMREACAALGASGWQAMRHVLLPTALPGLLNASLVALSRVIGATAPLLVLATLRHGAENEQSVGNLHIDPPSNLPLQIFDSVSSNPGSLGTGAALGIVALLLVVSVLQLLAQWAGRRNDVTNKSSS